MLESNNSKGSVLIAGGSGLIGMALYSSLMEHGYNPLILSRDKNLSKRSDFIYWNPEEKQIDLPPEKKYVAVVNLCGEGIADKKWSETRKIELIQSRTKPTHYLADLIRVGKLQTDYYLGASGVGIYPDSGEEWINEDVLPSSDGFLAECCKLWEEAHASLSPSVKKSVFRIGVVLSSRGGMLAQYEPLWAIRMVPFFGSGKQYVSWITDRDLSQMMVFAINNRLEGVYNAAASEPVTSKRFANIYLKSTGKKGFIRRIPAFALKLIMGQSSAMVLESQRVKNDKIKSLGFKFEDSTLDTALTRIIK